MAHQSSRELPRRVDASVEADSLQQILDRRGLHTFYGDLHNHTNYSDGTGHPAKAFGQMRARGLDFAAITEHGEFFDRRIPEHDYDRWAALAEQADLYTGSRFIAIRGFEWTSPVQGHCNVWWSAAYTGYLRTGGESMEEFYDWLIEAEGAAGAKVLAGFNHPGRELGCFDGCRYVPALDQRIVTAECFNKTMDYGEGYFRTLDQGWHVGAVGCADHHGADWGSTELPRTGVLAPRLTLAALQEAFISRRTFATRSATLRLALLGNGELMGSRLTIAPHRSLTLDFWCDDPSMGDARIRLELWTNEGRLVEADDQRGLQRSSWQVRLAPQRTGERWFAVRLLRDGVPLGYSSPIWASWG